MAEKSVCLGEEGETLGNLVRSEEVFVACVQVPCREAEDLGECVEKPIGLDVSNEPQFPSSRVMDMKVPLQTPTSMFMAWKRTPLQLLTTSVTVVLKVMPQEDANETAEFSSLIAISTRWSLLLISSILLVFMRVEE